MNPVAFKHTADEKHDPLIPENYAIKPVSLLLSTLSINILSLALPVLTLQVYDRILPNPGSSTMPVLVAGLCMAVMLEALLRLCRAYVIGRSGASYEHLMSCAAMNKILNADFSKLGTQSVGEYLQSMSAIGKLRDFYNGYALTTYAELLFVPIFLGLIWFIAGPLVLVPLVILSLFVAVSIIKGKGLKEALLDREHGDEKRFNFLIESLSGIHTLKALAAEKFFERRYEKLEDISTRQNFAVTQKTADIFNVSTIFSHLMIACVITAGAVMVLGGQITTGVLIATLLLSGRMMQPVQKALSLWARYQDYSLARERVEAIFATPQHVISAAATSDESHAKGTLDINHVRFRFRDEGPWLLDGTQLSLKKSEIVLIRGDHGCGKTTLLSLMAGLHRAQEGGVVLDGRPIEEYTPENLCRHIGLIRTQAMIFRGTIRDNITCFGQTEEAVAREISALLNVDRDVAKLPSGFDTMLNGNSTDSVPAGLQHRIAMARVLAAKPKIILFDNADRTLDKEGYATIYSLFARLKGKVSMALVSDDKNICALADRTLVLHDGRLQETQDVYSKGNVRPYKELRI